MVNDCIHVGLENNISTMKKLSLLTYSHLDKYNIYGNYKLCANARAAGILAARKKSIKRGFKTKDPYAIKPILTAYRGFKIIDNKIIRIPLGDRQYFDIPLNSHAQQVLSSNADVIVRSFTLTSETISISYSKEVDEIHTDKTAGVDRNLRNLTYGNHNEVIQYDLSQAIEIAETTRDVIKSFKRNDTRGTSTHCPQCGERLQEDRRYHRQLWCPKCQKFMDRDIVAAMNIGHKGWARFTHSKGAADEAMVQELGSKEPVILKVDAAKNIAFNP